MYVYIYIYIYIHIHIYRGPDSLGCPTAMPEVPLHSPFEATRRMCVCHDHVASLTLQSLEAGEVGSIFV